MTTAALVVTSSSTMMTATAMATATTTTRTRWSLSSRICFPIVMICLSTYFMLSGLYLVHLSTSKTTTTATTTRIGLEEMISEWMSFSSSSSYFSNKEKEVLNNNNYYHYSPRKPPKETDLPLWIVEYVKWHNEMRQRFPGKTIITDPNSPGVLLRWCGIKCGGLHDRLGQLPLDLFIANQTRRVLLIKWETPYDLSQFLQPPPLPHDNNERSEPFLTLDWTFPLDVPGWMYNGTTTTNHNIQFIKQNYPMITNIGEARFHTTLHDVVNKTLSNYGRQSYQQQKESANNHTVISSEPQQQHQQQEVNNILVWHVMGHLNEELLETKLQELGETDMIHTTPTFGHIWHMMFQPVPLLQQQLEEIMKELHLRPQHYTAVHCRVRHPKAYKRSFRWVKSIKGGRSPPDESGIPFSEAGPMRDFAVKTAVHAFKCAATRLNHHHLTNTTDTSPYSSEPYYFMSDSNDLVEFMVRDIHNETYRAQHPSMDESPRKQRNIYDDARHLVSETLSNRIVSRNNSMFNAHIDLQQNEPLEAYNGIFLDLYLAMEAKCVAYGLGFFALFASKLGGTTNCTVQYAKDQWSVQTTQLKANNDASMCHPKDYQGII